MEEVTILLPLYNEKIDVIEQAIDSIQNQTFQNFILNVTLDNPDNKYLIEYMKKKEQDDERIVFSVNDSNLGLAGTLNSMLKKVYTKYVARMDADDISFEQRIEVQYNYMQLHPEVDLCGTNIIYINAKGVCIKKNGKIPTTDTDIKKCLKYKNVMSHPTYFAKTQVMKNILYREDIKYAQDYDFICRFAEQGYNISNIDEHLLYYRVPESVASQKVLLQNMTAFYIKKYYRRGKISTKKIAEIVNKEIERCGQEKLVKRLSVRGNIENFRNSKNLIQFLKNIKLLDIHQYQIDNILSMVIYNYYIKKLGGEEAYDRFRNIDNKK